jgi:hypothetical protein
VLSWTFAYPDVEFGIMQPKFRIYLLLREREFCIKAFGLDHSTTRTLNDYMKVTDNDDFMSQPGTWQKKEPFCLGAKPK